MFLGTLDASILGNLLAGKDTVRAQLKQAKNFDAVTSFNKF